MHPRYSPHPLQLTNQKPAHRILRAGFWLVTFNNSQACVPSRRVGSAAGTSKQPGVETEPKYGGDCVTVMIIWLNFTVLLKGFFKMCMPFPPQWPLPLFHSCNLYVWVNSVLYKEKLDVGHFQSLEVGWWKISFDLWNKLKIVLSWYRYASILIHKVSLFNCGIIKHDVVKGGSKIFHSGLTTENSLVLLSVHNLFPEGLEKWPSCLCSLICEHQVNPSTRLAWKLCRSE